MTIGKIHPDRLLQTLKVLISPKGGIQSQAQVSRLVPLMEKFSRKLVSRIIYINILTSSTDELLQMFLAKNGWKLVIMWYMGSVKTNNVPLRMKILQLFLKCPSPPATTETLELLESMQILIRNVEILDLSLLALKVMCRWRQLEENVSSKVESLSEALCPSPAPLPEVESRRSQHDGNKALRVSYQGNSLEQIKEIFKEEKRSKLFTMFIKDVPSVHVPAHTWHRLSDHKRKGLHKGKERTEDRDLNPEPKLKKMKTHHEEKMDVNDNKLKLKIFDGMKEAKAKESDRRSKEGKSSRESLSTGSKVKEDAEQSKSDVRRIQIEEFKRKRKEEMEKNHQRLSEKPRSSFRSEFSDESTDQTRQKIRDLASSLKQGKDNPVSKPSSISKARNDPIVEHLPEPPRHSSTSSSTSTYGHIEGITKLSHVVKSKSEEKASVKSSAKPTRPKSPSESESNAPKLQEVDLFGSLETASTPPTKKAKSKRIPKLEKCPAKPEENVPNVKRKKVSWAPEDKLVLVQHFEVLAEERGNVIKEKFEEKRREEAKMTKFRMAPTKSSENENSAKPRTNSHWPRPQYLDVKRKDVAYGYQSRERTIQEHREAETPSYFGMPGGVVDPTEIPISDLQRRSMVVSVKSILFDDVSGEGKMTDYSNQGWPVSNKFTNTNTTVGVKKPFKVKKKQVQCIYFAKGFCKNTDEQCRFLHM